MNTCKTCKHWVQQYKHRQHSCENIKVVDMLDGDDWRVFEPPADFGCTLHESVTESEGQSIELDRLGWRILLP